MFKRLLSAGVLLLLHRAVSSFSWTSSEIILFHPFWRILGSMPSCFVLVNELASEWPTDIPPKGTATETEHKTITTTQTFFIERQPRFRIPFPPKQLQEQPAETFSEKMPKQFEITPPHEFCLASIGHPGHFPYGGQAQPGKPLRQPGIHSILDSKQWPLRIPSGNPPQKNDTWVAWLYLRDISCSRC